MCCLGVFWIALLGCSKERLLGPIYKFQYKSMKKLEPVRLTPILAPPSPTTKILHVRVYADEGYRRELYNWQRQVESLFSKVNFLFGNAYQLRLQVDSVSEWKSTSDTSSMKAMLAELKELDKGEGASWIVGFVTQLPIITTGIDTLGVTNYLGKHIVLRGSNDAAGLQALHQRLDRLDSAEVEQLYQRRRVHQELYIFIHELGHTLGALHTSEEGVMAPYYDSSNAWFVEANDDIVRIAVSHREDDSVGGSALATALETAMDDADSRGWNQPDIDRAWAKLASLRGQADGLETSLIPRRTTDGKLNGKPDEKPNGNEAEAILAKFNSHVGKKQGAQALKIVATMLKQPMTENRMPVAWVMAQRYAQEGNVTQERKLLGAIRQYYRERHIVPGSVDPVNRYELAQRYYRLGYFVAAEELLSVSPDKPEHAAVLAAIAQKRERYGVLAGSTSEDKEAAILALIPKALKLGYAGNYTRANALLSGAQKRNPRVSGISTARCDLSARERHFAQAAKHCARAIALHKGSSRAHYLAGGIAYQRRKRDNALKHLETAVAIDSGANAAWRLLAKVVRDSGELSELQALRDRYQKIHGRAPSF